METEEIIVVNSNHIWYMAYLTLWLVEAFTHKFTKIADHDADDDPHASHGDHDDNPSLRPGSRHPVVWVKPVQPSTAAA